MDITEKNSDEVVGLYINGEVYFADTAKEKVKECVNIAEAQVGFVTRSVFKFMAYFDLSPRWEEYANYPTLFTKSEYKDFCARNP